jgi:hypothetical protein
MACPIQARRRECFSFEVKVAGIKQIMDLKASAAKVAEPKPYNLPRFNHPSLQHYILFMLRPNINFLLES